MNPAPEATRSRRVFDVACAADRTGFSEAFSGHWNGIDLHYGIERLAPLGTCGSTHVVSLVFRPVGLAITGRGSTLERAEDRVIDKHRAYESAASKIRACLERGDASSVETRVVTSEDGTGVLALVSAKSGSQAIRLTGTATTECDAWLDLRERWARLEGALAKVGEFIARARPLS